MKSMNKEQYKDFKLHIEAGLIYDGQQEEEDIWLGTVQNWDNYEKLSNINLKK